MSDQPPQIADRLREEVYELADSLLRGTITDDEARRLKQLARQSAEARRHYARFMYDSVKLCQWGSDIAAAADERGDECRAIDGQEANVRPNAADGETPAAPPPLALPIHRSSFFLHPSLFGGVLFSYVVAALLLGIGVVAARSWRAEENSQVATAVTIPTAAPLPSQKVGAKAERVCAGTVTGANNCVWRGSSTLASCAAAAKFELVSGVLEITYGTGVKVSIRGPAYYVVRSADIGYLGLGTLTVRLDEVPDARSGGPEKAGGSQPPPTGKSPSRDLPSAARLFTVQTPNIDVRGGRGAVFNVLVAPTAECYTEIDRGSVGLVPLDNEEEELVALCQGQSALLALNTRGEPTLVVGKGGNGAPPALFTGEMPRKWPDFSSSEAIRGKTRQQDKREFRWRQSERRPS